LSRETRFELTTSASANVDLGIFDLSGRRVATIHRGALEAGPHSFRWDGTASGGGRVPSGVYFYRAQTASTSATRKLVVLDRE
jgi:flagellar hook assembly protein FlgD